MEDMTKQYEVLQWASLFLTKHDCEPLIAEILLQHHLNVTRSAFFMNMQDPVPEEVITAYRANITKHVETGIPVQHLTGYEMFYGRKFFVDEHVLIPRPETEELVQLTLESIDQRFKHEQPIIIDVGTGSGAIAVTLALESLKKHVYATDISSKALQMAERNALQLGAEVTFLKGDFLEPFTEQQIKADIIVSNPPYIPETDKKIMSRTVKEFDPDLALFAADNGLAAYKEILKQSTNVLKEDGMLFFEIGYHQASQVSAIIKETYPYANVSIVKDINGKDRIIIAKLIKE